MCPGNDEGVTCPRFMYQSLRESMTFRPVGRAERSPPDTRPRKRPEGGTPGCWAMVTISDCKISITPTKRAKAVLLMHCG